MMRGIIIKISRFLSGFKTLLLFSVIVAIVGVCAIQREKPLQNPVCQ